MGKKKRKIAKGVWRLKDGRISIRVSVTVRGRKREATATLPPSATDGQGIDKADVLRQRLRQGALPTSRQRPPSVDDYAARWLERRSESVRPTSYTTYTSVLSCYVLPFLGDLRIDDVRRSDLEEWRTWLGSGDHPLSPRSQQNAWCIGLMMLRDGWVDYKVEDPSGRVKGPKGATDDPGRALTEEGHGRFVQAARTFSLGDRAALLMLAYTGMRRNEVRCQLRQDLDLEARLLRVSRAKTTRGQHRVIPLVGVLLTALEAWLEAAPDSPFVWPGRSVGGLRSHPWLNGLVAECAGRADLGHLTPHDLRRTFITLMDRQQVNRLALRAVVGHARDKQTDAYVRPSQDDLRNVLKAVGGE